jgi:hypothetical protein
VLLAAYVGVKLELRRQHLRQSFGLIAGGHGIGTGRDTGRGANTGDTGAGTGTGTGTGSGAGTGSTHGGAVASWWAVARGTPAREWVPRGLGSYRDAQ